MAVVPIAGAFNIQAALDAALDCWPKAASYAVHCNIARRGAAGCYNFCIVNSLAGLCFPQRAARTRRHALFMPQCFCWTVTLIFQSKRRITCNAECMAAVRMQALLGCQPREFDDRTARDGAPGGRTADMSCMHSNAGSSKLVEASSEARSGASLHLTIGLAVYAPSWEIQSSPDHAVYTLAVAPM